MRQCGARSIRKLSRATDTLRPIRNTNTQRTTRTTLSQRTKNRFETHSNILFKIASPPLQFLPFFKTESACVYLTGNRWENFLVETKDARRSSSPEASVSEEPGESQIRQNAVEPEIPLTRIHIRKMMKANTSGYRQRSGQKIVDSWARLKNEIDGRALFRDPRSEIRPEQARPNLPKGHPPSKRQEIIFEEPHSPSRLCGKGLRKSGKKRFHGQFYIAAQEGCLNFIGHDDPDFRQRKDGAPIRRRRMIPDIDSLPVASRYAQLHGSRSQYLSCILVYGKGSRP